MSKRRKKVKDNELWFEKWRTSAPTYEPHIRVAGQVIMVITVFIPFIYLITIGDPKPLPLAICYAIPTIVSLCWVSFSITSIITVISMILFTLYLKG